MKQNYKASSVKQKSIIKVWSFLPKPQWALMGLFLLNQVSLLWRKCIKHLDFDLIINYQFKTQLPFAETENAHNEFLIQVWKINSKDQLTEM